MRFFIKKVISGGQTGADQGGLLAAWERGIPTGGWAPAEFRTNLGPNPLLEVLGLQATKEAGYSHRTGLNVKQADVTLIFGTDLTSPGSRLTAAEAGELGKPFFLFEFESWKSNYSLLEIGKVEQAVDFILQHRPAVINVAGNRDTEANCTNCRETRRVFGLILDLVKERAAETPSVE